MFSYSMVEKASLLVIATRQQIFVLDLVVLSIKVATSEWLNFVEKVYSNAKILKLVYGQDLEILQRAIPGCDDLREK